MGKIEVPVALAKRLQGLGPHFCLVQGKDPSVGGKGWQLPENLMFSDDPRLQTHLQNGGNYGVVTGYGLTVVEADHQRIKDIVEANLPRTFAVLSPGHRAPHYYFLCSFQESKPLVDPDNQNENIGHIKGQGGMVVGPGSIHPDVHEEYTILSDRNLAQVTPQQLRKALELYMIPEKQMQRIEATARQEKRESKIDLDILQVVPLSELRRQGKEYFGPHPVHGSETGRNFRVNPSKNCWHCFRHGTGGGPLLWLAVEARIIDCAEAGPGALRGKVFKRVLEKAQERGLIAKDAKGSKSNIVVKGGKEPSQADMLVLLCLQQQPELFHDQHSTPYARIKQNNINLTLAIRSRTFKAWLANLLWQAKQKAPGTEALYGAINILEAKALFEGKEYTLYNRVAPAPDGIWVDMTDDRWRAIKITREGWQIIDNPPILFKRYSHQKPLVEPRQGGDPWLFLHFANVDQEDKATRLLLLCTVISYLLPMIPHPILILYGIQGSGKTFLFKAIRRLIDPSAVEVLTLPRDERERVQQLDHHWCAFYDNITRLPFWMSDTLCRAATGGGFTKRELYTNDQDIIYNFKRCVGLNGINIAAQRGDLLDRGLLVGLCDIPKNKRRTEEHLLKQLEKCRADILGGFLDTLAKAIKLYPTVSPKELFRMADFTRWGCAIAKALGHSEQEFIDAYERKVKIQIEEAAHASSLATVLMDHMENNGKWEGTPSQLYRVLKNHAKEMGISTRQKAWPKAPNVLVRQLNELAPSLKSLGWEVVTGRKSGSKRVILINSVPSVLANRKKEDSRDSICAPSSSRLEEIKGVYWSDDFFEEHECCICNSRKKTCWIAEDFKEVKRPICEDCKDEWENKGDIS